MVAGRGAMDSDEEHRREAYAYAEWWRKVLPRLVREARLAAGLTGYRLGQRSGISREEVRKVEGGLVDPALCVVAQLAWGTGFSLTKLLRRFERAAPGGGKKKSRKNAKRRPPRRGKRPQ